MRIYVKNPTHTEKFTIEAPDDVPLSDLIDALGDKLGLPKHAQNGRRIRYKLSVEGDDSRLAELDNNESLSEQVNPDATLQLTTEMVAGIVYKRT